MEDNIFSPPLSPIRRAPPSRRVAIFLRDSATIYNKFSPYPQTNRDVGPQQPYIYIKLTDPDSIKNLTQFDTQAVPTNSAFRDVSRINKFLSSGKGRVYLASQALLQNENAFNETRIYNPLSVTAATAQPGTLGLTARPRRYIQVGGGIFSFFATAALNTVGISSLTISDTIEGTATAPLSTQIRVYGGEGTRSGLPRYQTSTGANSRFLRVWAGASSNSNFFNTFIRSLARSIPSTNPSGFLINNSDQWNYRIEYKKDPSGGGIYHTLQEDLRNIFSFKVGSRIYRAADVNRYAAGKIPNNPANAFNLDEKTYWYASDKKSIPDLYRDSNIGKLYERMVEDPDSYNQDAVQASGEFSSRGLPRQERTRSTESINIDGLTAFERALNKVNDSPLLYTRIFRLRVDARGMTVDDRLFSKGSSGTVNGQIAGSTPDRYNGSKFISGSRSEIPFPISSNEIQSTDVIFLYFFDLVNEIYIPFRAADLSGLTDQTSGEWDPVSYLGRADKLFIYKGFSRDVNFNFKVYANSIEELIPMWERINYLTGLVRPSKYTPSSNTNASEIGSFIYPPMITFRIGDLFIDQPAVLNNVSVTIPQESNWESVRGDFYEYLHGAISIASNSYQIKSFSRAAKSRQLPVMADISVSMKLLEKERSITNGAHYGYRTGNQWPLPL